METPPALGPGCVLSVGEQAGLQEELELVEEQEADLDVAALWAAVEEVAPRAAVMTAAATVVSLVPEDENSAEVAMRAALANRYATVRPFLA
ncbi:hypothetical protein [Streptomyces xinghaiensis]|uniref:hypothetical protein n=1 Tax=Streptomyces xinghaiensis TaxID=1038928 RepID=UPI0002E2931D|nr:hypothetical protein [Streptomyces xinghaiensis]